MDVYSDFIITAFGRHVTVFTNLIYKPTPATEYEKADCDRSKCCSIEKVDVLCLIKHYAMKLYGGVEV
jgi:hypothetical protein